MNDQLKPQSIKCIHPSGWEVVFTVGDGAKLHELIAFLDKHGYKPTGQASAEQSNGFALAPNGLPICPKHGAPMKKRLKQGDVWHSHAVIDPLTGEKMYCKGYHGNDSPGYDVDFPGVTGPNNYHNAPPRRQAMPVIPVTPAPGKVPNGAAAAKPDLTDLNRELYGD